MGGLAFDQYILRMLASIAKYRKDCLRTSRHNHLQRRHSSHSLCMQAYTATSLLGCWHTMRHNQVSQKMRSKMHRHSLAPFRPLPHPTPLTIDRYNPRKKVSTAMCTADYLHTPQRNHYSQRRSNRTPCSLVSIAKWLLDYLHTMWHNQKPQMILTRHRQRCFCSRPLTKWFAPPEGFAARKGEQWKPARYILRTKASIAMYMMDYCGTSLHNRLLRRRSSHSLGSQASVVT